MSKFIKKDAYCTERSAIGRFMYDKLYSVSLTLIKYRWLYWLLNFTWGILTTLGGLFLSLAMLCIDKKPKRFYSIWYFEILRNWGGMEMGTMFLRDTTSSDSINIHEWGHTFQNAILGPFFIFIVAIPSATRYWYRAFSKKTQPDYDAIWFEGNATSIGNYAAFYDNIAKKKKENK